MLRRLQADAGWRAVALAAVFLALVVKVAIPPGFMAADPAANGGSPVMICTGQGEVPLDPGAAHAGHSDRTPAHPPAHDAPCVFAGHGVAPPPAQPPRVADAAALAYADLPRPALPRDAIPGRGLAAPPPPSRGPPLPTV